jgi:hypothetical protein
MSFFSHCHVKYLTEPCHNDIIRLVDEGKGHLWKKEQARFKDILAFALGSTNPAMAPPIALLSLV